MLSPFKRCCSSKRECITYVVILLWITLGIYSLINKVSLTDVSVYFLSLTGFIGSYIYGESVRESTESSIFLPGKNSKRESLTYGIILMWTIIGFFLIHYKADIVSASTYFGSLTPFVGAYIIGETHREENPTITDNTPDPQSDVQINS